MKPTVLNPRFKLYFLRKNLNTVCENIDLASIATLPTEVGDGLEEQDAYNTDV
mgnify:CR=1 FL=1